MTAPATPVIPQFFFPTWLVTSGLGMPPVCAPHGAPGPVGVKAKIESSPPKWTYLLLLLGALPYIIVAAAMTKRVQAPLWPVCPQCTKQAQTLKLIGTLSLLMVPASCAGPSILAKGADLGAVVGWLSFVLAVAFFIGGAASFWFADPARVARAWLTNDGAYIQVKRPAPAFCQAVTERLQLHVPVPVPPTV
ncbi:hypothetical protein [Hamadaea tsunoensis]|uniref:hypothetical protein n=1 Tax=Hamadaea tsunoensis TaxID=53368 RepID=UPI00040608E7|nr:hypothetical protein [Hamadaea tsunoensis]